MRSWEDLRSGCRPWVIAHRGDSAHHPENTMSAFEGTVAADADALELDVRLSADGVAIVFHDDHLERTTDGRGSVEELELASIERLDAGLWFAQAFAGERIPTLERVLDSLPDRIALDLELKTPAEASDARGELLVATVARLVLERGLGPKILVSSFSARLLAGALRALPVARRLLLCEPTAPVDRIAADARTLGVAGVGIEVEAADAVTIEALQRRALAVLVFTINREDEMRTMLHLGVDGLFTNDVARLRRVVGDAR